jgi:hypothetical protein
VESARALRNLSSVTALRTRLIKSDLRTVLDALVAARDPALCEHLAVVLVSVFQAKSKEGERSGRNREREEREDLETVGKR